MKALVFFLLLAGVSSKIYERCEVAQIFEAEGLDRFHGILLGQWVCLASYVSGYDTSKVILDIDNSTDYGPLQINNRWWCNDGKFPTTNGCNVACSDLATDDMTKTIACAKIIVQQQGANAWAAWGTTCKPCSIASYIAGCDV